MHRFLETAFPGFLIFAFTATSHSAAQGVLNDSAQLLNRKVEFRAGEYSFQDLAASFSKQSSLAVFMDGKIGRAHV